MAPAHTIVGLGEILWDLLPSGRQLGGAPANFAYCSRLLGNRAVVASRVGNDQLGDEVRERLQQAGVDDGTLQIDAKHSTGTVNVTLDSAGQPAYEIVQGVAWDFMDWSPAWESVAKSADAVCFGTLAQRSSTSRNAIHRFLDSTRESALRTFDVNLRQNFYSKRMIEESFRYAGIVKLNRDESVVLRSLLGMTSEVSDDAAFCRELMQKFDLTCVCVTYGAEGSLLCNDLHEQRHPGFKVTINDTVGSGDAYTAGLVHGMLSGQSLPETNDLANRMGAWVASCSGGMPAAPEGGLKEALSALG